MAKLGELDYGRWRARSRARARERERGRERERWKGNREKDTSEAEKEIYCDSMASIPRPWLRALEGETGCRDASISDVHRAEVFEETEGDTESAPWIHPRSTAGRRGSVKRGLGLPRANAS
eukprot:6214590-Pleurochrysis_carterae.AAC.2